MTSPRSDVGAFKRQDRGPPSAPRPVGRRRCRPGAVLLLSPLLVPPKPAPKFLSA
ncbi:hypothetical protein M8494_29525 [Serratia ureilytica]